MKSFDQFNYSNLDLPESENLDEESLEELFGQIRQAGKLLSRMARSSNSGQGTGPKQLELPIGDKNTKGKLSPIPKKSSMQPKPRSLKVIGNKVGNFLTKPGVRMAGSAINQGAKAFKREFAAQPKISSTAPGTGFGAPFGGVMGAAGAGIKGAVTKGQTFDKNTKDKDGNRQLGKKAGSILSRARSGISKNVFGATPVRDQNKERKDGKVPVTTDAERKKPKSQTPASVDATKSRKPSSYTSKTPEASKSSALVRRYNQLEKTPGTPEYQVAQDVNKFEKNMKVKAGQESETTGRRSTGSASPEAKQNFEKVMSNMRSKRLTGSSPNQPRLTGSNEDEGPDNKDLPMSVRGGVASADRFSKDLLRRSGLGNTKAANQQDDDAFEKFLSKSNKNISGSKNKENTGTSNTSTQQGPKMLRPNISNKKYENNLDQYNKDKAAYDAQSAEFKTRKGAGRPKKPPTNEEFVSWREEFIWETEKIPSKKKDGRGMHPHGEIKPMSGKNNVTINPEDQSAKYKRGY